MMSDEEYVCTLNERSLEVARKELFEVPSDRLAAVKALRDWINSQTYLKFLTDTPMLLLYLRGAKFSQIRARELIENSLKVKTTNPEWMINIDTNEPGLLAMLKTGYLIPLPKPDTHGRQLVLYRLGCYDPGDKNCDVANEMRLGQVLYHYHNRDENSQVNGTVFIVDFTGYTTKHFSRWSLESVRKLSTHWQDAMPGRLKEFHFYNAGRFFEIFMSMIKQFAKKKYVERVKTHSTAESLCKHIPMELLPQEYLPDDYNGPSAGSIDSLTENIKRTITESKFRERMLEISSSKYSIDLTLKPADQQCHSHSFRKLAID